MRSCAALSGSLALAAAALAALALLAILVLAGSPAAGATKPVYHQCQHPVVTGEEASEVKGVSVAEACKVVRALGAYLSKPANIRKLYECAGETPKMPGRPVLLMHEFEGWKLKLTKAGWFVMYRPGASFRVTGTDFPVTCT